MWFYIWMIVFAMPHKHADNLFFVLFGSLSIALHLIYKDYVLRNNNEVRFQSSGRILLAIAPIAGLIAHRVFEPSPEVLDIFMAILAGMIMQSVFREELPTADRVKMPWFIAGVATFAFLVTVT